MERRLSIVAAGSRGLVFWSRKHRPGLGVCGYFLGGSYPFPWTDAVTVCNEQCCSGVFLLHVISAF